MVGRNLDVRLLMSRVDEEPLDAGDVDASAMMAGHVRTDDRTRSGRDRTRCGRESVSTGGRAG